jgi:hypothetical protein
MPDDLTDTHHRAGRHGGANRLVLSEYAVRMRDHDDAAPGHGAGEPDGASSGGEDLLAYVCGQVDAAVSRRVRRGRRLERPDDPKRSDGRPVNARAKVAARGPTAGGAASAARGTSAAANVAPAARDATAATARSNTRTG